MALARVRERSTPPPQAKRNLQATIGASAKLGNTPTICRKCYVHPAILDAYLDGELLVNWQREAEGELREDLTSLEAEEAAVLAFLRRRLMSETRRRKGDGRKRRDGLGRMTGIQVAIMRQKYDA